MIRIGCRDSHGHISLSRGPPYPDWQVGESASPRLDVLDSVMSEGQVIKGPAWTGSD